ncbi:chain length determinant protein EpsF [Duganella sp. FT134W]|uniref:Chain length determinant protein EpsF n=1 Tax=Duganella margarita TaxID=2692170 RepID=A0A7X4H4F1_9BURK|nr:chain length determinant protein EpsF [Duganella margarita]MYM74147.1 chain length determinant protein EpsF [Duganella margarita]
MNFSQFLLILRARQRIIWITLATVVVLTAVVSVLTPKTYKATSSVLLNYKGVDPVTGLTLPGQLLPGYMATQVDILTSKNVALRVVDALKLAASPVVVQQFNDATGGKGTVRDWLAELLLKKLDIVPSKESSVLEVSFSGTDPQFVSVVANAFADEYQKISVQLRVEPMKKASAYFDAQVKQQRDALEVAQSRLSKYQQEHGIVSIDNRMDVESNRLNDLSTQLVVAQGLASEASSRQAMAQGGDGAASPDVASNNMLQNLRISLGAAEAKFADVSARLASNHPQYISAKAELDKLREQLRTQQAVISSSVSNNAQIMRQRESAIRSATAEQKAKVLELNRTRDEMNILMKDVDSAQRAFDALSARSAQTKIEGQSEQADIAVLNPATPPTNPSQPKVVLNVLLSIFFGSLLGIGLGFAAELLDRRVRSERDLRESLQIPVLGSISWNPPKRRRFGKTKALARLSAN